MSSSSSPNSYSGSSENSDSLPILPGFPLSLQDICLLHVLFQVEEFPVESLALLPRAIRERLFNGLSRADILHLGTALFSDLEDHEQNQLTASEDLLDVILCGDPSRFISYYLEDNVLDYLNCEEGVDGWELYRLICETDSFTSLEASLGFGYGMIVPKHLRRFVTIPTFQYSHHNLELLLDLAWPLLHYCNMHCAPKELKIDCYAFQETLFWRNYSVQAANPSIPTMDPVIPFIQEFLSGVEVLELGTLVGLGYTHRDAEGARVNEASRKVPYVLLYNSVTSRQPHLKHLKLFGVPILIERLLEAIAELVCTVETQSCQVPFGSHKSKPNRLAMLPIQSEKERADTEASNMAVPLLSPKPEPYQLEGISILTDETEYGHCMKASCAQHIASVTQSIVAYQMQTLRSVTIRGLGFCYSDDYDEKDVFVRSAGPSHKQNVIVPAYTTLLSLLTQLLKQPQFQALNINKTPFRAERELIVTFLTTPTTHEQSLSIEGKDEEEEKSQSVSEEKEKETQEVAEDSQIETNMVNETRKRHDTIETSEIPPKKVTKPIFSPLIFPSQPLPETNVQYKCLDLVLSSSGLHSWLFSFPELKLKKLTIRTLDMTLVPADMVIEVEHVAFSTQTKFTPNCKSFITPAHLEKFVVTNPVLKRLEFRTLNGKSTPGLLPALNHCLSVLYQQGRGLEEIILNSVQFNNVDDTKEFFTRVRDLSHSYGTTLVMSPEIDYLVLFETHNTIRFNMNLSTQEDESSLFVDLSKHFQENKIKKIVFTENNESLSLLKLITEELVLHRTISHQTQHCGEITCTINS